MQTIRYLADLTFILDNDKRDTIHDYVEKYSLYNFYSIEADDVRNKERDKKLNNLKMICADANEIINIFGKNKKW